MQQPQTSCRALLLALLLLPSCCGPWGAAAAASHAKPMTMTASPSSLSGDAGWITVSWTHVPLIEHILYLADIVALYVSPTGTVDVATMDPFSFIYPALHNATAYKEGQDSFRWYITNHRDPVVVAYLRGSLLGSNFRNATILASVVIPVATPNMPMQINMAITPVQTEVRVTWSTRDPPPSPMAMWGTASGRYTSQAAAETDTYNASDLCPGVASTDAWSSPGMISSALLIGLLPGTRYYYIVGSNTSGFGWSSEYSFLTAPEDDTVRLLAWADHGAYNPDNSRAVLGTFTDQIEAHLGTPSPGLELTVTTSLENYLGISPTAGPAVVTPALLAEAAKGIYHAAAVNGDLSYAFGSVQRWDTWLTQIQNLGASMPLITSPGNHESDSPQLPQAAFPAGEDSGGECGVPYEQRMRPPIVAPRLEWYSADLGPIHFLQFSSEQNFSMGSEQFTFIENDLKAVNRSKTPWVIAGFHRPMYVDDPASDPTGNYVVSAMLRDQLEELFVKYQVDMTWTGHVHSYQVRLVGKRTCPVIKSTCVGTGADGVANGPVHVIMGHAGGVPSLVVFPQQPNYLVVDLPVNYGYCTVTANRTSLSVIVYAGNASSRYATTLPVIDTVQLTKPEGWKPDSQAAAARYNATVATPAQPSTYHALDMEALLAKVLTPKLLLNARALTYLERCFGSSTKAYKLANSVTLPVWDASQCWQAQYSLVTFLKAIWKPNASDTGDASLTASLDYAYTSIVKGRGRQGTPSKGCRL